MFVEIVVRGNCWPYRDIFKDTVQSYWNKQRKCPILERQIFRGRKMKHKNLELSFAAFQSKTMGIQHPNNQLLMPAPEEDRIMNSIAVCIRRF